MPGELKLLEIPTSVGHHQRVRPRNSQIGRDSKPDTGTPHKPQPQHKGTKVRDGAQTLPAPTTPPPYKMSRRKKIQKKYIPLNYYHYHHYYYYIIKRHSHIRESAKSRPTCQLPIFTCQRAKSVSIIELGVPTCEKNRGANFSTSLARRRTSFSTIFQFLNF